MDATSNTTNTEPDLQASREEHPAANSFRLTLLQCLLYMPGYILAGIVAYVSSQSSMGRIIQTWEIWLAVSILVSYTATVFLVARRIKNATTPRRVGKVAWLPTIAASLTIALIVISFCQRGLSTPSPWLTLWLSAWLISRTLYFSNAVRNWTNPDWIRQVVNELLRGLLLLQGCVLVSLLSALPGVIAFTIFFILFPLAGLIQRRKNAKSTGN